ncbi:MAG TPA: hypothetical protein DCG75_16250 [Bacteroidales bacterium]|nr:hypothetical protein [Bacteroidales bacterium]
MEFPFLKYNTMKKIIFSIITFAVLLSACTEPFDTELKSSYIRLVIQGSINNELKPHQVSLTKSADYFSNTPATRVTGAEVSISDGENTFDLHEVSAGLYETDTIAGETGKTYTLTIISEGKTYTSSCYLNYCPPMDSINFGYYDLSAYDIIDSSAYILLNALEPPTPNNFYMWNVYRNGILETDTINEVYFSDDMFINGHYMYNVEIGWVRKVEVADIITLEMLSITNEYYNYIYQILSVTDWNMGPFGGPPANPNGNIIEVNDNDNNNDDPLGFFLAYSTYRITDTIPEKDQWFELKWY